MLTFDQKLEIIESFPQLQRKDVSLGRVNFHFEESAHDKKIIVYHLHPNGNGFVYAGHITGHPLGMLADEKGLVSIRDYEAEPLRALIEASIHSLSHLSNSHLSNSHLSNSHRPSSHILDTVSDKAEESWIDSDGQTLLLVNEDDLWNVYCRESLEMAFDKYKEAERYLHEEGFTRREGSEKA